MVCERCKKLEYLLERVKTIIPKKLSDDIGLPNIVGMLQDRVLKGDDTLKV